MSKKLIERKKFRLTVKLDYGWDADLIRWLETLPEGYRSEAVRQTASNDAEARYGSKLDQMLGGLSSKRGPET